MKKSIANVEHYDGSWKLLYTAGGAAALVAGVIFRRNLGVEISLFSAQKQPDAIMDWFALLQTNRLLGLSYLHFFDVVNYALVGLMFLALYIVLRRANGSLAFMAAAAGFSGIVVYFATNTAFSLLTLSDQYAAAASEEQRTLLLAAGQAMLAINRFSSHGAHPGSGGYLSLLLIAAAGLMFSVVMLRSGLFNKAAAFVGIGANGLDLAYCLAYAFAPAAVGQTLAVAFIPAAGLLFMIWHILVGWRLIRLGRVEERVPVFRAV
jgi:hypothetical protein